MSKKPTYEQLEKRLRELEKAESKLQLAVDELQESKMRYRELFLSNPHPMWVYDLESLAFLSVNDAAVSHYGYSREEFLSMTIMDIRPSEDVARLLDNVRQVTNGLDKAGSWYHIKKDKSIIEVEITSHTLLFNGRKTEMVLANDITAHKQAEKALQISERRYRTISELTSDLAYSYLVKPDGMLVNEWTTGALHRLTGYSRKELRSLGGWEHLIHPDSIAIAQTQLQALLSNIEKTVEYQILTKDKKIRWVRDYARPTWNHRDRRVTRIEGAIQDITEQKRAEEILQTSHKRFLTVLDSIDATVYVADFDTHKILFMNKTMIDVFGRDMTGDLCWKAFRAEATPCQQCNNNRLIDQNGKPSGVYIWHGQNPLTEKWYINHDRAIEWTDGRLVKLQIAIDITEQKTMEEKLRQAQKMEAIGTLAGGVAHDLNNILSAQVSYPDLILLDLPENSPLRKPILTIQKSGKKAAAIVQDLLTLARRGVVATEIVNLNNIIDEYLKSPECENLIEFHTGVKIDCDLEPNLLNIMGSSVHLSTTIANMISNAAEAMPGGGKISVATQNRYMDKPVRGYEDVKEGDYVILTVSDSGAGISSTDLEKIFEPFYTKKVMGRSGTGLGMAVVWGTVKDHKGYIELQSVVAKGTTFTLYFPVTRKNIDGQEEIFQMEEYMGNGESILVVDDVEEQREIACRILSKLSYSVTSVSSGEEAVTYLKGKSADLLILDMIMDPGIDGLETYKEIMKLHPNQKAIIASGFSETDIVKEAQRLGAGKYLKKPYTFEKIGLAVKKELRK